MNWRITSPGHTYQCDESTVVYFDPMSGNTHLLSEFAGYVIQEIGRQSLTFHQIVEQVKRAVDHESIPDINAVVQRVLGELASLDLIEQH